MIGLVALAAAVQASPPQVEVLAAPVAIVAGHTITHPGDKVAVHVPASATYIGHDRFNLFGVADAEIHVFVDAGADKKVKRLYWVQFESYLPSPLDRQYDYSDGNTRAVLWGTPTWVSAGPRLRGAPTRPGSDREHVDAMLARAGYTLPAETMNVRLVQLLDDPQGTGHGTREVMVIYGEDLAPTGKHYAELVTNNEVLDQAWKPFERPLINRAVKAVRVEHR